MLIYLLVWETYARQPLDETNNVPKQHLDFRERVRRETLRGRWGIFHENIEMYWHRHWRGYTVPRAFVPLFGSLTLMLNGMHVFVKTFPNIDFYKGFRNHPNYKLLGGFWSTYYLLRPLFWMYLTVRFTKFFVFM